MAVDYEKLGEVIDGYGGISADDLEALPAVADTRSNEIALLRDENARLRRALADVELILTGLRGDRDEFWIVQTKDGAEVARHNPRYVETIEWAKT